MKQYLFIFSLLNLVTLSPTLAQDITITPSQTENSQPSTRKEIEQQHRAARIAKERENPSSRFKQKAQERAKQREIRQQEIREKQLQNASRFQKEALEKDAAKVAEQKGLSSTNIDNKSRFTLKAEEKARQRALKEQRKLERKRNRYNN